jgi:hypothetical protein
MSADATQEQGCFGSVDESVVLGWKTGEEDFQKDIVRDVPHGGYKSPVCVDWPLERCAQLFELAEDDFHLLDSSFHPGEFIGGIYEKCAYLENFGVGRNVVRVQSIREG